MILEGTSGPLSRETFGGQEGGPSSPCQMLRSLLRKAKPMAGRCYPRLGRTQGPVPCRG